ncbi:MAG: SMP-30/gluconolactonase/LRE family protein [Akkermansiaceae bacterium]|nr:SMP-30/gluconolactonase/LRE family protein [Akkermansiaceae bacterium]
MKSPFALLLLSFPFAGWLHAGPESIERLDPALDRYFAAEVEIETLCQGFRWSEGPVWDEAGERLLFSDVPVNKVYQWKEGDAEATVFLDPSGFTGNDRSDGEPGSNGLMFDARGRLLSCEHGDRRVSVLTPLGGKMTVADRFEGKRFNSPNDLAVHPDGSIWFTDPPYGLPRGQEEKSRELDFHGVFRWSENGGVTLIHRDLERPNGIAFSPDAKTLYVANSHAPRPVILAFPVKEDGGVGEAKVFFDAKGLEGPGMPDGLKVHPDGTVFATGPGGVLVISPAGKLLGRILCTRPTANLAFGPETRCLFITSQDRLLRVNLKTNP